MITRIKGTHDVLDTRLLHFLLERVRAHLAVYQFHEISTPIIEPTELFVRSLGTQTDVVSKEMFLLAARDERESICLRPEATASIARSFVENGIQTTPWKVFTYGPMFRYERPQKGRYRQFSHISMEIIGAASYAHDVTFITMLDRLFADVLLLRDYALHLNFLGCPDDRTRYITTLRTFVTPLSPELCATCAVRGEKNVLRIFDCKQDSCQKLYAQAPKTVDHLCTACTHEWEQIRILLDLLAVSYSIIPALVRGLDYYSKTVFEFVSSSLGAQNTFCGGGRYDQLIAEIGGKKDQPAVGAAIGVERLLLMLETIQNTLPLAQQPPCYVVLPLQEAQLPLALIIADHMRAHGLATEVLVDNASVKSMMRAADKSGAAYAMLVGQEEQEANQITIKNMRTGASERIAQIDLVKRLKG